MEQLQTINCWYCGGNHHSEDCRDHKVNVDFETAGDPEAAGELLYLIDEFGTGTI